MRLLVGQSIIENNIIVEARLGQIKHQDAIMYKYRCKEFFPKKGKISVILAYQIYCREELLMSTFTFSFQSRLHYRKLIDKLLRDSFHKALGVPNDQRNI